jgi:hypothetical protein
VNPGIVTTGVVFPRGRNAAILSRLCLLIVVPANLNVSTAALPDVTVPGWRNGVVRSTFVIRPTTMCQPLVDSVVVHEYVVGSLEPATL